jgi:signal recognition particle subunit SEC65
MVLPPAPAPQLTSVKILYPKSRIVVPKPETAGIHDFLREYLPRLKYYNPAVDINVRNPKDMRIQSMVTLEFESTDPEALKAIAHKSRRLKEKDKNGRRFTIKKSKKTLARRRDAEARKAARASPAEESTEELETTGAARESLAKEASEEPETPKAAQESRAEQASGESDTAGALPTSEDAAVHEPSETKKDFAPKRKTMFPIGKYANDDQVVLKTRPPANPNAPSTVSPPTPVYIRRVKLATNNRPSWEIWKWLQYRIRGGDIPKMTAEEKAWRLEYRRKEKEAEKTREMTKEVTAKIKEEQASLVKAQRAAEAAAAGNI